VVENLRCSVRDYDCASLLPSSGQATVTGTGGNMGRI
jgi:hypothetical protein